MRDALGPEMASDAVEAAAAVAQPGRNLRLWSGLAEVPVDRMREAALAVLAGRG